MFARMDAENAAMTNLSDSTGGKFFKNSNDFLQSLNDLMVNEGVYSLSFSPPSAKRDGKFLQPDGEGKAEGRECLCSQRLLRWPERSLRPRKGQQTEACLLHHSHLRSHKNCLPLLPEPPKPAANEKGVPAKSAADGPVAATGVARPMRFRRPPTPNPLSTCLWMVSF